MIGTTQDLTGAQSVLQALTHLGAQPLTEPTLDDGQLAALYESVCQDIEAGRCADALDDAFVLVANDPWERAFLLALAWCLHHLGQWESAGGFYSVALMLDATDALCAFRIGECLVAMGEAVQAREAFEAAITLSALDERYAPVCQEARQALLALAQA